jgi:hypothetical protein
VGPLLLSQIEASVIGEENQFAKLGKHHGAGNNTPADFENSGGQQCQLLTAFNVARSKSSNNLCIDFEKSIFAHRFPNGIVIHHDPIVKDIHIISNDRLIVIKTVRDQTTVPHHQIASRKINLVDKRIDFVIRPVNAVVTFAIQEQATRVFASLLCVFGQRNQIVM